MKNKPLDSAIELMLSVQLTGMSVMGICQRVEKALGSIVTGTKPVWAALPWNIVQSGTPAQGARADRLLPGHALVGESTHTSYGMEAEGTACGVEHPASAHSATTTLPM